MCRESFSKHYLPLQMRVIDIVVIDTVIELSPRQWAL